MQSKPLPLRWMGAAFFVSLALAAIVLSRNGTSANGLLPALQLTARWSFLLFWVAYAGGAVAALFGPALAPLGRRGREFGLAYASAMTVHFSLVIWFFHISANPPYPASRSIFSPPDLSSPIYLRFFRSEGWPTLSARTLGASYGSRE